MCRIVFMFFICACPFVLSAQKKPIQEITRLITRDEVEAHLLFLAADEMRGRDTGSPEIDIAANYLATEFKRLGLKKPEVLQSYFQPVNLVNRFPAQTGKLTIGQEEFLFKEHFVQLEGGNFTWQGEVIFAGYASEEDLQKLDVKGKMVVAFAGQKDSESNPMAVFMAAGEKRNRVIAAGGVGLIELFALPQIPWPVLVNYFANNSSMTLGTEQDKAVHLWLRSADAESVKKLKESASLPGKLVIDGARVVPVMAKNVVGILEGSDPKLKSEYLVVSAHYDHVGVSKRGNQADSIFNGARDNAIGVTGLLATARYLSFHKPRRSVLFIAFTAEEKGLLGSRYYVQHPVIPMRQCVFNFNCDGAGYNNKTMATIIGMERTSAENDLIKACEAFGLKAAVDPVPQQNLFERSDNLNFARLGVPAITFAPGLTDFDAEINKYYHQPADEVASLDFDYLIKYFRAYVYANVLLANATVAPVWKAGDKFEAAAKNLYKP
ncbi:MAG: M28 family peptidase [Cyclobacteriaceae bacterium]|nr:M28 family peptidase [Cyclobacteriaceae bacterium]